MLSLKRGVGQGVRIGENVQVRVMSMDGCDVRLAIVAPRHVPIARKETKLQKPQRRSK